MFDLKLKEHFVFASTTKGNHCRHCTNCRRLATTAGDCNNCRRLATAGDWQQLPALHIHTSQASAEHQKKRVQASRDLCGGPLKVR